MLVDPRPERFVRTCSTQKIGVRFVADISVWVLATDFFQKLFVVLKLGAPVFDRGIGVDLAGHEDDFLTFRLSWQFYIFDAKLILGDFFFTEELAELTSFTELFGTLLRRVKVPL